jgi:hypothetical protein
LLSLFQEETFYYVLRMGDCQTVSRLLVYHEKLAGTCHAERGEASEAAPYSALPTRMLRHAQHDTSASVSNNLQIVEIGQTSHDKT